MKDTTQVRVHNKFSLLFLYSHKSTMTNPCNQFVFNMLQRISIRKMGFVVSKMQMFSFIFSPRLYSYVCAPLSKNVFFFCTSHERMDVRPRNIFIQKLTAVLIIYLIQRKKNLPQHGKQIILKETNKNSFHHFGQNCVSVF